MKRRRNWREKRRIPVWPARLPSRPASAPIVEYRFNWGDGTPDTVGSSATATHSYGTTALITYVVRLTVTDAEGRQGTTTVTITYP